MKAFLAIWLALSVVLPLVTMNPLGSASIGSSNRKIRVRSRTHQNRINKKCSYKQRVTTNSLSPKNDLKTSMLNINGLSDVALADVEEFISTEKPDIVFLLETKRRMEELCSDISIEGYDQFEVRRSDTAGHKDGGGIACYTRQADGLVIRQYSPDILNSELEYVNNERVWLKVESLQLKTAVLGVYMGCQYPDDRHGDWNDNIYSVLRQEVHKLRHEGYRIIFAGDMNGHVGALLGQGVIGNKPNINKNGQRFLDFLRDCELKHINDEYRTPGDMNSRICQGMWTRQCGLSRTIIDFAGVSAEDIDSVISMRIDDTGALGGNSDHNWITLVVKDKFKRVELRITKNKTEKWNIAEDQDWTNFKRDVLTHLPNSPKFAYEMTINQLASKISTALYAGGSTAIGFKPISSRSSKKARSLPSYIVKELQKKRNLESTWKTLRATVTDNVINNEMLIKAETEWNKQKQKVSKIFAERRRLSNKKLLGDRHAFWSAVSGKVKQSADISAVMSEGNVIKCDPAEIASEVENYLCDIFQGSLLPDPANNSQQSPTTIPKGTNNPRCDHMYATNPTPILPCIDESLNIDNNPSNWLDRHFTKDEIINIANNLNNNKACGFDRIPNEFIKNAPDQLFTFLTILFNRIKDENIFPCGWNRGRITLVHKRGVRTMLSNYRPLTVLISLCGLYSKVLNGRLTQVVERHGLLGETQGGFRKGRGSADNIFILNSVFWKAQKDKSPVHLGFIDITKAYDSVNRELLWRKFSLLGINGKFLDTLKSMYTEDTVDSVINGVTTRKIYLKRGLRQGCSLSPLLFNLYISDIGHDLATAGEGFDIGNGVTVSGLLFADDIVVCSKTPSGLKNLLNMVNRHCEELKLVVSEEKSQIVSPTDDDWELVGEDGLVKTLKQVMQYKYLGVETFSSIFRTFSAKQKKCVQTAKRYLHACIHLGKCGSDLIKIAMTTWESVAVPSILYGCESVIFCETKIAELESIQSQVAKRILGVPKNTSNLCAQTELGFKPMRLRLLILQLQFYFRVLRLPNTRWVKIAMLSQLKGAGGSAYAQYICNLRASVSLYDAPPTNHYLRQHLFRWSLCDINSSLSGSPSLIGLPLLETFAKAQYVCPSEHLTTIASFKMRNAGLGNKCPLEGYDRFSTCPLCPSATPLNEELVLFACESLHRTREATGIETFKTICTLREFSLAKTYSFFVNGWDFLGHQIPLSDYFKRGTSMFTMRSAWLSIFD